MSIQSIRDNSQSVFAKIIVGAIVVTFALFGVDAIVGNAGGTKDAAKVNGEKITELSLVRATEMLRRQVLAQMGQNANPDLVDESLIRRQALDNLIERQLLLEDASENNMQVAGRRVDSEILNSEVFQENGQFNRARYESVLRNVALTPLDYKTQLTQDLIVRQTGEGIGRSAFYTPAEIAQIARLDKQTRNLAYLTISAENLLENISVSEEQAKTWYEDNRQDFMTEEMVSLEYLELQRSDFYDRIEVDEAEIELAYEQELESLEAQEERQASHILIAIDEEKDIDQAREELEKIKARLDSGERFEELAKNNSDDPGSAANGGDLGFAGRGVYVGPFEEALFAMNRGDVSGPIETEFGVHLIRLDDIRVPEKPDFESLREQLLSDLKYRKAEELLVAASEQLENDSFSAGDLLEPAENLGLEIKTTEPFSRAGGTGIAADAKVIKTAFSDSVLVEGNNSDLIEISKDQVAVIRVKEHQPAEIRGFEETREEITGRLKQQLAREEAQKLGEGILAELGEGKSPEQIETEQGYQWQIVDKVKRNQADLSPELVKALFKMPKPASGEKTLGSHVDANGDFLVLTLTKVYEGGVVDYEPRELAVMGRFLANQTGSSDYTEYRLQLRDKADIEKY